MRRRSRSTAPRAVRAQPEEDMTAMHEVDFEILGDDQMAWFKEQLR